MKSLGILLTTLTLINAPVKFDNHVDPIYQELLQDETFDPHEFLFNKDIDEHKEYNGLLLHEHESNDLIFYVYNVTGFDILKPNECRISLAYNGDEFNHYKLDYLGNTQDKKFYKFKINDFLVNKGDSSREYKISEFEVRQERVYLYGSALAVKESTIYHSSSINQSYLFDSNGYTCKSLTTITLDVKSDYYRVPGSTTALPFAGVAQNDIFYIYFLMPKQYGDLIKIDMEWYENFNHYKTKDDFSFEEPFYYDDCYSNKYFRKVIDSEDNTIIDENKSFFWNPSNWFVGGSKGVNLKNLQRFSFLDIDKIKDEENEYCLSKTTIDYLISWLKNPITLSDNDPYIIRYSVKEFYKKQYQHQGNLGQIWFDYEYKLYSMTDIDVITCTFLKNGKTYTLPVVSNTNNQYVGTDIVPNNDWKWVLALISFLLVLLILIPVLPYLIQLIAWIITLPFKLIKWIINLFKKDNKKKK